MGFEELDAGGKAGLPAHVAVCSLDTLSVVVDRAAERVVQIPPELVRLLCE